MSAARRNILLEAENDELRRRLLEVTTAALALCDTVEAYTRQAVLRSVLLHTVNGTRRILAGGGYKDDDKPGHE